MTPQDQEKFAKACRAWIDKNPEADVPMQGAFTPDGEPLTPRTLIEYGLFSGELFEAADMFLALNPGLTIDDLIEMNFGPQEKTQAEPQPEQKTQPQPQNKKTSGPKRHYKI